MILPRNLTLKALFCFLIILAVTDKTLEFPNGEKTFDIKLGFDLIQGADGSPVINLLPFKDSGRHARASDEDSSSVETTTKTAARAADSNSGSSEEVVIKKNSGKGAASSEQSSEENNNDSEEVNRFTQAGVFEPEGKKEGDAASSSEDKRRKRSVKRNKKRNMKKIGHKFPNARKLGVSKSG